jgi:hypothetical protein
MDAVVEIRVSGVLLRVVQAAPGFVVSRLTVSPQGEPLQLRRWRFTPAEVTAIGTRVLAEALAAGEAEADRLRTAAQQAARRAFIARERMRPGAATLRALEQDCVAKTAHYLARGRDLVQQCAAADARLTAAGLTTPAVSVPAWMQHLLASPEEAPTAITTIGS